MHSSNVIAHPSGRVPAGTQQRPPTTLAETRLGVELLSELAARHLLAEGALTVAELGAHLGLLPAVVRQLTGRMQQQGLLVTGDASMQLTAAGQPYASSAFLRSSYRGPAPVSIEEYGERVLANSVRRNPVRQQQMRAAFDGVVVADELLDAFGRGLNSDRAMLVSGPAGSGKTYLTQRLIRAFAGPTLIPHAIAAGDAIIPVYDPALHESYPSVVPESATTDNRYVLCRRPGIIAGAQLTLEMLELRHDALARAYHAPLQLKANNGVLIVDDVGRQRMPPEALLNRWIMPLETQSDWLMLDGGQSLSVPFDVMLILVTNRELDELGGEVFRRRLGHKVRLAPVAPAQYEAIWRQFCDRRRIAFDPLLVRHAIDELHERDDVPLLSCHPGDLLSLMLDQSRYAGGDDDPLGAEMLEIAWASYFPERRTPAAPAMNSPGAKPPAPRRNPC